MTEPEGHDAGAVRSVTDPVVVYIVGSGRSGSTLLDRMLGQADGVVAIGELAQLWSPGELDKLVCGCREPVRHCPFWSAVADKAYGGWDTPEFRLAVELRSVITRHRFLLFQLLPQKRNDFAGRSKRLGQLAARTYTAISEVSGCPVVVDSSKEVAFAYVLVRALRPRLRLVHLVRNGHGVVYSWTKAVPKPELGNPDAQLPRYNPLRMAARWVLYNLLVDPLRLFGVPTLAMQYEGLVEDPRVCLAKVLRLAEVSQAGDQLPFVEGRTVHLTPSHTVAGNPMRFLNGPVTLKLDEAWRDGMRRRDRVLVTLITSPLLLRFGYLRPRQPGGGRAGPP